MRAIGVDISTYQDGIDYSRLSQKADFVFVRAAYGKALDKNFVSNADCLMQYSNLMWSPYFFALDWLQPAEQVSAWKTFVSRYSYSMFPAVDIEMLGMRGSNPDVFKEILVQFENVFGIRPIIYTNMGSMQQLNFPEWLSQYYLWRAEYPRRIVNPQVDWPMTSIPHAPFEKTLFWQYSDLGPGAEYGAGSKYIDVNVSRLSAGELRSIFAGSAEKEERQVVITENARIRSGPGIEYATVGLAYKNTTWTVAEEFPEWIKLANAKFVHRGLTRYL